MKFHEIMGNVNHFRKAGVVRLVDWIHITPIFPTEQMFILHQELPQTVSFIPVTVSSMLTQIRLSCSISEQIPIYK